MWRSKQLPPQQSRMKSPTAVPVGSTFSSPDSGPVAYMKAMDVAEIQDAGCVLVVAYGHENLQDWYIVAVSENVEGFVGRKLRVPDEKSRLAGMKVTHKQRSRGRDSALRPTNSDAQTKMGKEGEELSMRRAIISFVSRIKQSLRRSSSTSASSSSTGSQIASPSKKAAAGPSFISKVFGDNCIGLGDDARSLFTPESSSALLKAAEASDFHSVNPVTMQLAATRCPSRLATLALAHSSLQERGSRPSPPFYLHAILTRAKSGDPFLIMDLQPVVEQLYATSEGEVDESAMELVDGGESAEQGLDGMEHSVGQAVAVVSAEGGRGGGGGGGMGMGVIRKIGVGSKVGGRGTAAVASDDTTSERQVMYHQLALRASTWLQKLPPGDMARVCHVAAREVRKLTGYDRVMVYRFHEDEHGEVVAEDRRGDWEPYLGLHYPATDIPRASRMLFLKAGMRAIHNSSGTPVKVLYDPSNEGAKSAILRSSLRSPHACHREYMRNMGTASSLTFAIVVTAQQGDGSSTPDVQLVQQRAGGEEERAGGMGLNRLWGLVVCHHHCPRFPSYPARAATRFFVQAVSLQINIERELHVQAREREVLRIQSLLCDALLLPYPLETLFIASPNLMDLLPCSGAAAVHSDKILRLGAVPSDAQVRDLVKWARAKYPESAGLCTDSLLLAGYPRVAELDGKPCGMLLEHISATDAIMWFRPPACKEIVWGGQDNKAAGQAKGAGGGKGGKEKELLCPRESFKAFMEVVRDRCMPWEEVHLKAARSLQDLLRKWMHHKARMEAEERIKRERLEATTDSLAYIIDSAAAPIIAVDDEGVVTGWNKAVANATGLEMAQAMGRHLVDEIVHPLSRQAAKKALEAALKGIEERDIEIRLRASHISGSFMSLASDSTDLGSSGRKMGSGRVVTTAAERAVLSRQDSSEARKLADAPTSLLSTPRSKSRASDKVSVFKDEGGKGDDTGSRSSTSSRSEMSGAGGPPVVELLVNTFSSHDKEGRVVGVCLVGQDVTKAREAERGYAKLQGDYEAIVNTKHHSLMPPIFACNEHGVCIEWNTAMVELSAVPRSSAINKSLLSFVFGRLCRHARGDGDTQLLLLVNKAMTGHVIEKTQFVFYNAKGEHVRVLVTVRSSTDMTGQSAVFFFVHHPSPGLLQALIVQQEATQMLEGLASKASYLRGGARGPSAGVQHCVDQLTAGIKKGKGWSGEQREGDGVTEQQQVKLLRTMDRCNAQLQRAVGAMTKEDSNWSDYDADQYFDVADVISSIHLQAMQTARQHRCEFTVMGPIHADYKTIPNSRNGEDTANLDAVSGQPGGGGGGGGGAAAQQPHRLLAQGNGLKLQQAIGGLVLSLLRGGQEGDKIKLVVLAGVIPIAKNINKVALDFRVLHTNTLSAEQLQEVLQSSAQPQALQDEKDDDLALSRPNVTVISKGLTLEYCLRACRSIVESLGGEITYIPGGISEDDSRRSVDSCFSVFIELPLLTTRL